MDRSLLTGLVFGAQVELDQRALVQVPPQVPSICRLHLDDGFLAQRPVWSDSLERDLPRYRLLHVSVVLSMGQIRLLMLVLNFQACNGSRTTWNVSANTGEEQTRNDSAVSNANELYRTLWLRRTALRHWPLFSSRVTVPR